MNLNEAQSLFKKNILNNKSDAKAERELIPAGKMSLEQAFQLYHRGYITRLTDALGETFESAWWVLGDQLFQETSRKYIASQPSVSYNLSDYGHNFPEYLKVSPVGQKNPFLYDLTRFEWMFKNMYHTPTPDPLPIEHIQGLVHSEDFKVHFIEGMDVFQSPYSIYDIWRRRKEPASPVEDINWMQPESLLIYKKQKKIYVRRIEHIEAQILTELKDGASVAEALADFSHILTQEKIAQLFQMMMKAGIIEDVLVLET